MSKENELYRPILETILSTTGKHLLTIKDVSSYLDRSENWCRSHIGVPKTGITAEKLALILSRF